MNYKYKKKWSEKKKKWKLFSFHGFARYDTSVLMETTNDFCIWPSRRQKQLFWIRRRKEKYCIG